MYVFLKFKIKFHIKKHLSLYYLSFGDFLEGKRLSLPLPPMSLRVSKPLTAFNQEKAGVGQCDSEGKDQKD